MPWWRAYIDKKNGEHSRVFDWEADYPGDGPEKNHETGSLKGPELPSAAKLKSSEQVNQIVSIGDPR